MEIASLLAGQRWSDHPRCTHRRLAAVARRVDDELGDSDRQRLLPLIPEVVGANLRHPVVTAMLAQVLAEHGLRHSREGELQRNLRWAHARGTRRVARYESGNRWWRYWLWISEPVFAADGLARQVQPVLTRLAGSGDANALVGLLTGLIAGYRSATACVRSASLGGDLSGGGRGCVWVEVAPAAVERTQVGVEPVEKRDAGRDVELGYLALAEPVEVHHQRP